MNFAQNCPFKKKKEEIKEKEEDFVAGLVKGHKTKITFFGNLPE